MPESIIQREIRSYVIREGRITEGQRRALEVHWPHFGLNVSDGTLDATSLFPTPGRVVIEIGFGMGDSLFETASTMRDVNFIGIEVHRPGVGHLLIKAADAGLDNLKVFNADSQDVIEQCIPDNFADVIQVFFPDPWHKKRHNKRRLLSASFCSRLVARLKPQGILHVATDWIPYAEEIVETMSQVSGVCQVPPPDRPVTKYERRGTALGHVVTDLAYRRTVDL